MSNWKKVLNTNYLSREGKSGVTMLVLEHEVEGEKWPVREYVNLNHKGKAREFAEEWWVERAVGDPPERVMDAMNRLEDIKPINALMVENDGKFIRVSEVRFGNPGEKVKEVITFEEDDIAF
jgi:hypothetical protein